jgi:hypothetical protein
MRKGGRESERGEGKRDKGREFLVLVFPALSRPSMSTRISLLPKSFVNLPPIFAFFLKSVFEGNV